MGNGAKQVLAVGEGRESVFLRHGTKVPKGATIDKAIEVAGLDWTVGLVPAAAMIDGKPVVANHRFAVVREDNGHIFDFVGQGYRPVQNAQGLGIAQTVKDFNKLAPAAEYEPQEILEGVEFIVAGQLANGRVVWVQIKLPNMGLSICGEDPYDLYGLIETSHDGKRAVRFHITPTRIACLNQLNQAMAGAQQRWVVRHAGDPAGELADAHKAAGIISEYTDVFSKTMAGLVTKKMSEKQLETFLTTLLPDRPKRVDEIADIKRLAIDSPTNAFGRGTRYAALQAVREYFDYVRPQRTSESAFIGAVTGTNAKTTDRALALLTA